MPVCGAATIIRGKAEYGGGWLCFSKKGGCGAKYSDGDFRIEGQETGRVPNPDIADVVNTILKMAKKRALIDAVLNTVGAISVFHAGRRGPAWGDIPPAAAAVTARLQAIQEGMKDRTSIGKALEASSNPSSGRIGEEAARDE